MLEMVLALLVLVGFVVGSHWAGVDWRTRATEVCSQPQAAESTREFARALICVTLLLPDWI
jgi:hypothetical protein